MKCMTENENQCFLLQKQKTFSRPVEKRTIKLCNQFRWSLKLWKKTVASIFWLNFYSVNNRKKLLYHSFKSFENSKKKPKSNKIKFNTPQCTNLMSKKKMNAHFQLRIQNLSSNNQFEHWYSLNIGAFAISSIPMWMSSILTLKYYPKKKKKH